MLKLYFGNTTAIIATLLAVTNIGYMVWGYISHASTQKWGLLILLLILLNGAFWYFANIRDLYSNSIVYAIDGSVEMGLFSANSIQSILYWVTSGIMWIAGIVAIFKPQYRKTIFYFITVCAFIQIAFIEGSRIRLYNIAPSRYDYM